MNFQTVIPDLNKSSLSGIFGDVQTGKNLHLLDK